MNQEFNAKTQGRQDAEQFPLCVLASLRLRVNFPLSWSQASKTYYIPGPVFLGSLTDAKGIELPDKAMGLSEEREALSIEQEPLSTEQEPLSTEQEPLSTELGPLSEELGPLSEELRSLSEELPDILKQKIDDLGKRSTPEQLDALIVDLCHWRHLGLEELQFLTGRKMEHLRQRSLRRLMAAGRIDYLYPENPTHPEQKYRAIESEDE